MKFKELGCTGEFIPSIGQGCMGIGGNFEKNSINDDEYLWALQYGIDLGMTFLDTAEVYANGHSETLVGKAVKGKRDKIFIASKFSPENSSFVNVLKSAENSLKRLGTTYIDLYQIHWPNPSIPISETMKALEKLVKDGKVRFIGLSNFNKNEMEKAQKYIDPIKIVSNQLEYNLFDRFIESSIMQYMLKNNSSIIAYSPLDKGHDLNNIQKKELMKQLSEKYNKTTSQISLNWLLANKNVFVIPKATNKNHIELNATSSDFEMDIIDLKKISNVFSAKPTYISPKKIKVSQNGQDNRKAYETIEEAIENRFKMHPSPVELANFILAGDPVKPVRVVLSKSNNDFNYELIEGRLRYWAWCIAFNGEKDIPCIIR